MTVPFPLNEAARLAAVRSYDIIDTPSEEAFDDIARLASYLTGCPIALVTLVDETRLFSKAHIGTAVRDLPREHAFCSYAIVNPAAPLTIPDATRDPRFADNPLVVGRPDIRAYLGVPLINPEGYALGTLCVLDREARSFTPDVIGVVQSLARTVMTSLELRRAMLAMHQLALTDALTGLPNRMAFIAALSRAMARQRRERRSFALLYLDLDGFKQVNDMLGHAEGDRVLAEVAEGMRSQIGGQDVPARIGGDEFGVVLLSQDGIGAPDAAEKLRREIEDRMRAKGWRVSASIGAVVFRSEPSDEDAAIRAADRHMYEAKKHGKNRAVSVEI